VECPLTDTLGPGEKFPSPHSLGHTLRADFIPCPVPRHYSRRPGKSGSLSLSYAHSPQEPGIAGSESREALGNLDFRACFGL